MDDRRLLIKGRWRYWRRMQRISQAQVARYCGVSRGAIARWEDPSCYQLPDVAQLATICEAIGVKPDAALMWLLCGGAADGR